MITCCLNCRSVTFRLFFCTRMLRPFTADPNPCSRFCVTCRSRSPEVKGFKLKNWLLTLM